MTAAEQWTAAHGFDSPSRYRNTRGELLAEPLADGNGEQMVKEPGLSLLD